jgi:hypothetical protein
MKPHPMILCHETPTYILYLDTETLTLARWQDNIPHSLFIQSQKPPAPETMKAFHRSLVGFGYQGQPPLFVTSATPVSPEETIPFLGHGFIAAHHPASTLTLLYGGTDDIPPLIRKSKFEAHRPQIPEITLDLVADMNDAIGRTTKNGIPVAPFMVDPRLIG